MVETEEVARVRSQVQNKKFADRIRELLVDDHAVGWNGCSPAGKFRLRAGANRS